MILDSGLPPQPKYLPARLARGWAQAIFTSKSGVSTFSEMQTFWPESIKSRTEHANAAQRTENLTAMLSAVSFNTAIK